MTVYTNKDVVYGKIEYRREKVPIGTFFLKDSIDVEPDDRIKIIGNTKDTSTTQVTQTGINGVTEEGEDNFTSTGATFSTNGIAAGDMLILKDGDDIGSYIVASVDSETQLSLNDHDGDAVVFNGDTAISYEVGLIIFDGLIEKTDFSANQEIRVQSIADELLEYVPNGTYAGYSDTIIGRMINDGLDDGYLNNVSCTQSASTLTLYPNEDIDDGDDWNDNNGDGDGVFYEEVSDDDDDTYLETTPDYPVLDIVELGLTTHSLSEDYNYSIYKIVCRFRVKCADTGEYFSLNFYDGSEWCWTEEADAEESPYIQEGSASWEWYELTLEDLAYTQDDIADFQVGITPVHPSGTCLLVQCSKIEVVVYYRYYPNLDKSSQNHSSFITTTGKKSLATYLSEFAQTEGMTWYLTPSLEVLLKTPEDSTVDFARTDSIKFVEGERAIKTYSQVQLLGAYSGSSRITSVAGSGYPLWKDTRPTITNQDDLDTLAETILTEKSANQYTIRMVRRNSTHGLYQVGETVSLPADPNQIKFDNSDRLIPDGEYILNKIDYYLAGGQYDTLDIELIDGLIFTKPKQDETTDTAVDDGLTNADQDIATIAGGESAGEANTGQNIGSDGVGVYDSKSGSTLRFRNIAPGSAKITVTENGDDIDIDVDEGEVDHDALTNFVADEHVAHSEVSISAGTGLTGGGSIAETRTISLSHLGIESLADPNADKILFWDDGEGACKWLAPNTGLAIDGTNLNCSITQYTDEDAVEAVEDAGLVLSATKTITTGDEGTVHTLGRTQIGHASFDDYASFEHRDMTAAGQYALLQSSSGDTFLNAASGKVVYHRINNDTVMNVALNGVQIGSDARITEFDTGALAASNTVVPTSAAVKTYVDNYCELSKDASPQLAADLDLNDKVISIIAAPATDHHYEGIVVEWTNSQSFGTAVRMSTTAQTVELADADAPKMPVVGISVASNKVLTHGIIRDDSWNWTIGGVIYASTTAGALTQTVPTGANTYVQVVGVATHADMMFVNISLDMVKRAS